jgi:hypothetical protein
VSDRFERMARRARERAAERARQQEADAVAWARSHGPGAALDRLEGEGLLRLQGEHRGHRDHANLLHHGNAVICSCGAVLGAFSHVPLTEAERAEWKANDPGHCRVCRSRGIGAP